MVVSNVAWWVLAKMIWRRIEVAGVKDAVAEFERECRWLRTEVLALSPGEGMSC